MKKNYFLKTRVVVFLWCFMLVFAFNLHAQTSATLNAVLSGNVNSANVLTNGDITNIASSADRGYLKFDLTSISIPVGAVIVAATIKLVAIAPSTPNFGASTLITPTTLDAATAGAGFFAALNTATTVAAGGGWTSFTTLPNTFEIHLSPPGVAHLNTALSAGQITYGIIGGASNICTYAGYNNATVSNQPRLSVTFAYPCSGIPTIGTPSATPSSVCKNFYSLLDLSFSDTGCSYQWQSSSDGITFSNIGLPHTYSAQLNVFVFVNTYYRCVATCISSGLSATSQPIIISINAPTYATIPYFETFESSWINGCRNNKDIVSNSWRNYPVSGDESWRRQDEGVFAIWNSSTTGIVSPSGSTGAANFHSFSALSGAIGTYDLYIDLSSTSPVSLGFNYQNATGTDKLEVLLSTDGGVTFGPVLGTYTIGSWAAQTLYLGVVASATSVIRFKATSDFGNDDIGIDNVTVQDFITGINENTTSQDVFVYPNPTNGSFRIEMNNITFHELAIKIVDIQGKEVFSSLEKNVKGTYTKQLNLEAIPKGMYFIILSSGSEIKTQKLIIQ